MRRSKARQVALVGVLFALALVLGMLEGYLAPLLGLPPGVKIGLANVVVMFALVFLSAPQALLLVLLKAGFGFIARGAIAGLLSLCGGLLSLGVMALLAWAGGRAGLILLSVLGALAHNAGQLLVIVGLFGAPAAYYYPVLAVSGVAMGCLTAVLLRALLPALHKAGFGDNERRMQCK